MEAIPTQRSTDTVAAMKRRPLRAVVFVPGALFWALLIAGFVTHSDTLLGVATTFACRLDHHRRDLQGPRGGGRVRGGALGWRLLPLRHSRAGLTLAEVVETGG